MIPKQPDAPDDAYFMALAMEAARSAEAADEVPIGAVLVQWHDDGSYHILAQASNANRALNDPSAHAEMLAIRMGCGVLKNQRLSNCELYVTLEPCAMCAGAISFARIDRVIYGAPDPKGGGIAHGGKFYEQPTCHHRPEVSSGVMEEESSQLLKSFFQARRNT